MTSSMARVKMKLVLLIPIAALIQQLYYILASQEYSLKFPLQRKATGSYTPTAYTLNSVLSSKNAQQSSFIFDKNEGLPYFYKPLTIHPNDIFRLKYKINVTSFEKLLRNDTKKTKLILYYNIPSWVSDYFMPACSEGLERCPIGNCQCSVDPKDLPEADGVIIDGPELRLTDPPTKYPNQVWIFSGLEPPTKYVTTNFRSQQWRAMFNWTMTYRLDSDVVSTYDVLVRQSVSSSKNFTKIAQQKAKGALWIVSNCKTESKREEYVKLLQEYYQVDIFGRCSSTSERIPNDLVTLQKNYKFYLSFENSFCDDYVTEKLFKLYNTGIDIIPIVRGSADYASLIPSGTYINTADFKSPRELAEYLKYLDSNVTAFAEFLRRKDMYIMMGDFAKLSSPLCDICVKLHNLDIFSNHYYDVSQWLEKNVCHKPIDY